MCEDTETSVDTTIADTVDTATADKPKITRSRKPLSEEQTTEIRSLYTSGFTKSAIARQLGVSVSRVTKAVTDLKPNRPYKAVTNDDVSEIEKRLRAGAKPKAIAAELDISVERVRYVTRRIT